ncbi:MAG TPA: hypothetical protein GXX49_07915 [Clostridiaceae bacterium]|nr:hypothetical protein [Clostridiaceae bacterium]
MDLLEFITTIDILPAICFILGFILVIFEMFNPGFGAAGVTGIILLILGIIQTANTILEAFILIIIIIAILGIALTLALHSATKGRLSKTLVLNDSLKKESGYIGTEDLNYFLNREGTTLTVLKPSGIVDFDGVKLDVVSESEFLPKGTKVRVIKVSGRRIVVRKIEDN